MNRHQTRELAMRYLYQHLLLGLDAETIISLNAETIGTLKNDYFFRSIFNNAINNRAFLIEKINSQLSDWRFERLGYVEQAILLLALTELFTADSDRAVIINEAVELAKTYGEENSYVLINGVLDKIHE